MSNEINPQLQKLLDFLSDGQTYSRTTSTKSFSVVRFDLSEKRTRASKIGNVFDQSFLGVWVIGSNKKKFQADFYVNDNNNSSDAVPLRSNMTIPFSIPVSGATLSWEAQEGTYIDVLFSHNSAINVGSIEQELKGVIVNSDGSDYDHGSFTAIDEAEEILPIDFNRGVSTIFNYSTSVIYLGKKSVLDQLGFENKSIRLLPDQSIKWRNSSNLFVKTTSGTAELIYLNEVV